MIPKQIHYTWFSGEPFPERIQECIESWHKHMPEYEYVLWALLTSLFMLTPIFSKAQQYEQLTDVPTVYIETEKNQSITCKEDYINCTVIFVDGGADNDGFWR